METDHLEGLDYIFALPRLSGKAGLHRMHALCQALGNPQNKLKFVHLAGTNGKGSVAVMLQRALTLSNYRTGLYISPFVLRFHERIQVDGECIGDDALARHTETVRAAMQTLTLPAGERIGQFEFITALSFLYFAEQACDFVVLETGLGGRHDATNIVSTTMLAVITPISLDHTDLLGNTVAEIAREKAAIIKNGCAVVSSHAQAEEAQLAVEQQCVNVEATLYPYPTEVSVLRQDILGTAFVYQGQGYRVSMPGAHQLENATLAIGALNALEERGVRIDPYAIVRGIASASLPGRLHVVKETPLVMIDGAHNEAGIAALMESVRTLLPGREMHVVMAMVEDKAYDACIARVARRAKTFGACAMQSNPRGLSVVAVERAARRHCETVHSFENVTDAVQHAMACAGDAGFVLICGSLFLAGEAEKLFRSDRNR